MERETKTILLVDDEGHFSYHVALCLGLASKRLRLVLISRTVSPSCNASRYVDKCVCFTGEPGSSQCLQDLENVIRDEHVDMIFPVDDDGIVLVQENREKLERLCDVSLLPSLESFTKASDKWELYQTLTSHNISTPLTAVLDNLVQFERVAYPVIVKPARGRRGQNIRKLDAPPTKDVADLVANTDTIFLIQEFVEGYDIDCSVLCQNGKIVTYTIQKPLGTGNGFAPKIEKLKFLCAEEVLETVARTMAALRWDGVAHLDLRYNSKTGSFTVIEINGRYWASQAASHSAGVNFPWLHYLLSRGIPFETVRFKEGHYASFPRFFRDIGKGIFDTKLSQTELRYLAADPQVMAAKMAAFFRKLISRSARSSKDGCAGGRSC